MNDFNDIPPDQLPFHYDRDERLKSAPDNVRNKIYAPRKKFVIDRRLLIIMIDIVIVVIAFFGISAYQNSKARKADFQGVKLELMAVEYDGEVLAGLKMETIEEQEPGTFIRAEFFISGETETGTVEDLVPAAVGDKRILRYTLKPVEGVEYLKVRVEIGGMDVQLEKKISGE